MFILINILATITARMKQKITFSILLLIISAHAQAQWSVMTHTDTDSGLQMRVATIENEEGFKLEIYRDTKDVIRIRFNIRQSYDLLASKQCPTFQVDDRKLNNRSSMMHPVLRNLAGLNTSWGIFQTTQCYHYPYITS